MSAIAATTRASWRHPEWWALALSVIAWGAMFRPHAHHGSRLANWMIMTSAMMLPLVVGQVRFVAERSLWRRRHRAIAGFVIGYLAIWLVAGIAVSFVEPSAILAAAALAVAGAWQLTRYKRVAMASCHRAMPLAPRGWRADRDCIHYGWMVGTYCFASCWSLMLACAMAGHHLLTMGGIAAVMYAERYTRPRRRVFSAALFAAAIAFVALSS